MERKKEYDVGCFQSKCGFFGSVISAMGGGLGAKFTYYFLYLLLGSETIILSKCSERISPKEKLFATKVEVGREPFCRSLYRILVCIQKKKEMQIKSMLLPFRKPFADGAKFVITNTLSVNGCITAMAHVLINQC